MRPACVLAQSVLLAATLSAAGAAPLAVSHHPGSAEAGLLALVTLGPDVTAADIAIAGAPVLFVLDSACLVRTSTAGLAALAARHPVRAVAEPGAGERLVYAALPESFDRSSLARFGAVAASDHGGVLIAASAAALHALRLLGAEVAGVSPHPVVFSRPSAPQPAAVPDSLIWLLVNRVSPDSLRLALERLVAFKTRYCTTDSCRAAMDWLKERLAGYGCDSVWSESFDRFYAPNVIGIKRGSVHPGRIYVVCAHVDDYSESLATRAPGSDDNASGAGLVVEVARVCADMEFENSVLFIGFSAEEEGLIGSDTFAHRARLRGDSILLAVNFDMVSYGRENLDSIRVVYTSNLPLTESLAAFFLAQADTFTDLKTKKYLDNSGRSDHASFWRYGFLAIRGGYNDRTPKYHTIGDTIGPLYCVDCGTNNIPMYTEVVRATVATLAKLAGAYQGVGVRERSGHIAPRAASVLPTAGGPPFALVFPGTELDSRLCVIDACGRFIRTLTATRGRAFWDGADQNGRPARAGVYVIRAASTSDRLRITLIR